MLTPSSSATARWALAAVLLLSVVGRNYGLWSIGSGGSGSWGVDAFMDYIVFIAVLILVAWEAIPWVAERFSLPFVEVYFPNLAFPRPPLSYVLAHHYRDQGRFEDAVEQYQKIIRYYPHEEAAYAELLAVAAQIQDWKLGERYALLYQRRFPQEEVVPAE